MQTNYFNQSAMDTSKSSIILPSEAVPNQPQITADHRKNLNPAPSFTDRFTEKLWEIANEALAEDIDADPATAQLKSVIGMVHTVVRDGRAVELDQALRAFFPEFYNEMRA